MTRPLHAVQMRTWRERQWKGILRRWQQIGQRMPERIWVAFQLVRMVFSPTYQEAQRAVRAVAVGGRLSDQDLGVYVYTRATTYGKTTSEGENMFRRGEAFDLTVLALREKRIRAHPSRIGTALEVAYLALRERGK